MVKGELLTVTSVCLHNMAVAEMVLIQRGSPLLFSLTADCYNVLSGCDDLHGSELELPKHFFYSHL